MTPNYIDLRLPMNLRTVWAYPNLLHFDKYVDLLMLSANTEPVFYNKTYIYVKPGFVLLKYSFFAFRWRLSQKVCRSIFNVLSFNGWIKIKTVDCPTVSNRKFKNVPLITFPKIGYADGTVMVSATNRKAVGLAVSLSQSETYKDEGQASGTSKATDWEDNKESYWEDDKATYRDSGRDSGRGDDKEQITTEITDAYEEEIILSGTDEDTSRATDSPDIININRLIDRNIKEKNKKEKIINPPKIEEIKEYAFQRNIRNVDLDYFYNFYDNTNWTDSNGEPIKNWKKLLVSISAKIKKNKETNFAYGTKKPSATDKLARQAAELASHYAGILAEQENNNPN